MRFRVHGLSAMAPDIWVVLQDMGPYGLQFTLRHLTFGGTKMGV